MATSPRFSRLPSRPSICAVTAGTLLLLAAGCAQDPNGTTKPPPADAGDNTLCGNGTADGSEPCDGADLKGNDCASIGQGFTAGSLSCQPDCSGWDTSACGTLCNNGTIDVDEVCDGANLGGNDCASIGQGFDAGVLACQPDCTGWDTSACQKLCGNEAIDPNEECDGKNLDGNTCETLNHAWGTLTCNASCKLDVSGCADLVGMVRALQDTAASVWTVFNPPFMTGSEQWRPDWIPLDTCVSGPFALASISVMSNLHAGKLTISGGIVDPVTIVPLSEGPIKVTTYKDDLPNGTSLLVAPGDTLTLTGAGGDDVGPFNASVKAPSSLKGLTHGPLNAFFGLDSTKPMSFTWPLPAHDGDVLIYLSEWDDETYQTTAELLCHPADDGSFEVPVSDMSWFSGLHPGTVRVQRWSSSMAADTKGNGTLFAVVAQTEESIAPILPPG